MGILILGGQVVAAEGIRVANVLIEGERISGIGSLGPLGGDRVIDARGKFVLPGGVDVHTHLDMPVSTPDGDIASSDDFYSGHVAAAFGGTTTHLDFANQAKGHTLRDTLDAWQARARDKAVIDYGFHLTVTDGRDDVLDELSQLKSWGVNTVKMLMAYKGRVMVDDATMFKVMQRCAVEDLLVMTHCENGDAIHVLQQQALAAGRVEPIWHAHTRPPQLEAEATQRAARLAEVAGCRLYVVHVTSAGAVEAIGHAKKRDARVHAETCIQYFYFTRDDLRGSDDDPFGGAKWVCSPPFREATDQLALWRAVESGALDVVSTDHCPWLYRGHKDRGRDNFVNIPNGVPSIEHRMTLLWDAGVNGGRLTPQRFVELTATNPAKLFGLYPRKGVIAAGADADLVVWDPDATNTISVATHKMRVDYDCWEGTVTRGKPVQVIRRGELLVDGDEWLGRAGSGQFLSRG